MTVLDLVGLLFACWRTPTPRTLEQPMTTAPTTWPL